MKWIKKGLIYGPTGNSSWAKHSALQPTPLLIDDNTIRVFVGFRDDLGIGRVGYVDVSAENPGIVQAVSKEPVLDIGLPGTFDENGVIPCAIVPNGNELYLYYAGYQIPQRARFTVFSGLAISNNGGESFSRVQNVPILERTHEEFLFRVIHTALIDNGVWKVWYGAGNHFVEGKEKSLPVYNIRYMESSDGLTFSQQGKICIDIKDNEYRVGRPYVDRSDGVYKMYFAASTYDSPYRLAYAESSDGVTWERCDQEVSMEYNEEEFDNEMSSYPAVIRYKGRTYMFYNGNNYGQNGFGYAELEGK